MRRPLPAAAPSCFQRSCGLGAVTVSWLHCFTETAHRYASGWRNKDICRQMGSWVKALGKSSRRGSCLRRTRSGKRTCSTYSLGAVSVSGGTSSLVHRRVLLIRSQNEAGSVRYSQGTKVTEYGHAVIKGVGQEMIWKLGQKIRIQERWKLGKQGSEGKKKQTKSTQQHAALKTCIFWRVPALEVDQGQVLMVSSCPASFGTCWCCQLTGVMTSSASCCSSSFFIQGCSPPLDLCMA